MMKCLGAVLVLGFSAALSVSGCGGEGPAPMVVSCGFAGTSDNPGCECSVDTKGVEGETCSAPVGGACCILAGTDSYPTEPGGFCACGKEYAVLGCPLGTPPMPRCFPYP